MTEPAGIASSAVSKNDAPGAGSKAAKVRDRSRRHQLMHSYSVTKGAHFQDVLMSRRTNFLVQAFDPEAEDKFKPGGLIVSRTAGGARRTTQRFALSEAGVVVSSTISDSETGDLMP
jgi:hypothetical protein